MRNKFCEGWLQSTLRAAPCRLWTRVKAVHRTPASLLCPVPSRGPAYAAMDPSKTQLKLSRWHQQHGRH